MKHYSSVGGGGGGAHNDNKFSYAYVPYRRARIKQEQRYNTHLARHDARWKKKNATEISVFRPRLSAFEQLKNSSIILALALIAYNAHYCAVNVSTHENGLHRPRPDRPR